MLDKNETQKMSTLDAWELPEELQQLRDTVRRFMVNEVKPIEDKLPHDAVRCPPEELKQLQAKAKGVLTAALCCTPYFYATSVAGDVMPLQAYCVLTVCIFGRELMLDARDVSADSAFGMKTIAFHLGQFQAALAFEQHEPRATTILAQPTARVEAIPQTLGQRSHALPRDRFQ